jgi:hypothetical protein
MSRWIITPGGCSGLRGRFDYAGPLNLSFERVSAGAGRPPTSIRTQTHSEIDGAPCGLNLVISENCDQGKGPVMRGLFAGDAPIKQLLPFPRGG